MKRNFLMLFCCHVLMAHTQHAARADASATIPSIGIVDTQVLMTTSLAAKSIKSALDAKKKEFQTQIEKEEKSLRSIEKELVKQKATLSQEEFGKKDKAFQKKIIETQKMVRSKTLILDRALAKSMSKLRKSIQKVVNNIADQKKLSMVLTKEDVILYKPEMDLTKDVLKNLNADVKSIKIDWSSIKPEKVPG